MTDFFRLSPKNILILFFLLPFLLTGCSLENDEEKAEKLFNQALQAIETKKDNEALIWLQKTLQKDPNLAKAHYQLGRLYRKKGDANLSYTELNRAIILDSNFKEAKKELAFLLVEQNALENVVQLCEQYTSDHGQDPEILLIWGNALILLNKRDEAVVLSRQAVTDYPEDKKIQVLLVRALVAVGEGDEARQLMKEIADRYSNDINIQLTLSLLYEQLGLHQLRLKTLEQIKSQFSQNPLSYLTLSRVRLLAGEFDQAQAVLEEALAARIDNTDIHQMMGMIAHKSGQQDKAEQQFKKAVEMASGESLEPSQLLLADYYIFRKKFREAQAIFEQLLEQGSKHPMLHAKITELYMAQGKFDEARISVEKLLEKNSGDAQGHLLRGMLMMRDNELEEARKEFSLARELNPNSGKIQFLYGLSFMEESNIISMTEIGKALKKDPNMIKAYLALARLHAQAGQFEKAVEEVNAVLSKQPENEKARILRIGFFLQMREIDRALQDSQYLVDGQPDNLEHLFRLAEIYSTAGNTKKAMELYQSIQAKLPGNTAILHKLIGLHVRAEDFEQAHAAVDRFLEQFPDKTEALTIKARVYLAQQQFAEAESLLLQARDRDPGKSLPLLLLGDLYRTKNDFDLAIDNYTHALSLDPKNISILLNIANLHMGQGNYPQALSSYEKLLAMNDSLLPALNNLAYLYSETGQDLDRALELAQKANKSAPKNLDIADTLGWIYVQKGAYGQAETYLNQALKGHSESPIILYHMGVLRYRQKQAKEAERMLQSAIDKGLKNKELENAEAILTDMKEVADKVAQAEQQRNSGKHTTAITILEDILAKEGFSIDVAVKLATAYSDLKINLPKAVELAEQAYDTDSSNAFAADALGWVYLQQGSSLMADRYLKKAVNLQPDSPQFRYHYGVLLLRKEQFTEAKAELEMAIAFKLNEYDRGTAQSLLQKIVADEPKY